jgi:hypothetical protein
VFKLLSLSVNSLSRSVSVMNDSFQQQGQQQDQQLPVDPVVEQPAAVVVSSAATTAPCGIVDPVVPNCNDVISSRFRLTKNNGNANYDLLVQKYKEQLTPILAKLSARDDTESFIKRILTQGAERVVDIVCRDRGGRFLKLAESTVKTGAQYTILSRKNSVKKVSAYFRRSLRLTLDKTGTPKAASTLKAAPETAKIAKNKDRSMSQYRIQFAESSESAEVDPYMLDMITAVCNHAHSVRTRAVKDQIAAVARLLETPPVLGTGSSNGSNTASPCTPEAERQGRMRFQLRHRYLAAARVGVSPVDLSQRLIKHWKVGHLILAPPPQLPTAVQVPMPVPPSLPQPEMMDTAITGTNITVVVADPLIGQDHEHGMLTESSNAVTVTVADPLKGQDHGYGILTGNNTAVADPETGHYHEHGMLMGNNTAVAVAVADPEKSQDREHGTLMGNNTAVAVADPEIFRDHEHGMLPGSNMRPLDENQSDLAAPSVPTSEAQIGVGQWNKHEKAQFLRGLELYGSGNWSLIVPLVPTR